MLISHVSHSLIVGPSTAVNSVSHGGTEAITRYLCESLPAKVVHWNNDLKKFKGRIYSDSICFIGMPLNALFKYLVIKPRRQKCKILVVFGKLSYKMYIKLACYRLLQIFGYEIIGFKGATHPFLSYDSSIDPYDVANNEVLSHSHNRSENDFQRYTLGYIGRICNSKGFFKALEIFCSKEFEKYSIHLDLLIWHDKDLSLINILPSNISIKTKKKSDNSKPAYSEIKVLVLPYSDVSSSVIIPLVPIEAALSGCSVLLPLSLKKTYSTVVADHPILEKKLFFSDTPHLTLEHLLTKL